MAVAGDYDLLEKFSAQLDACSERIAGWGTRGRVFVEFSELKRRMATADDSQVSGLRQWEMGNGGLGNK